MFIVAIEGCDCVGKATQAAAVHKELERSGYNVIRTSFPAYDHTVAGGTIRRYLRGDFGVVHPEILAYSYAADRAFYMGNVLDSAVAVEANIILFDRYMHSNFAYGGARLIDPSARSESRLWYDFCAEVETGLKNPFPHLVIYINVPRDLRRGLMASRKNRDINEIDMSFQDKVAGHYDNLVDYDRTFFPIFCESVQGGMEDVGHITDEIVSEIVFKYKKAVR